jgi:CheY-like chemotaxis protein
MSSASTPPPRSSHSPFSPKAGAKVATRRPSRPSGTRECLHFLVIDDNADGRFLVAKTLLRKFPQAVILECQTLAAAFDSLQRQPLSAVIAHRALEAEGIHLVCELRKQDGDVPILMMSGIDRQKDALMAGANAFLTAQQWLLVGSTLETLLGVTASDA